MGCSKEERVIVSKTYIDERNIIFIVSKERFQKTSILVVAFFLFSF